MRNQIRQFCSIVIQTTIVAQMAFGPLANAQISTGTNSDLGSGTVIPSAVDPNGWFNPSNSGSGSGTDNPFSGWDDPSGANGWNNSGPVNGGWGDPSSNYDPTGIYSSWGGYSQGKITNSWWANVIQASMAVNKDFAGTINNMRKTYAAVPTMDQEDYIADLIIRSHAKTAGLVGMGTTLIPQLLDFLFAEWRTGGTNGGLSYGYTIGLGIGGGIDIFSAIRVPTDMNLQLAELYGQLPVDPDERIDMSTSPFIMGLMDGGANKVIAHHLLIDNLRPKPVDPNNPIVPPTNPFNPDPIGPVFPNPPVATAVKMQAPASPTLEAVSEETQIAAEKLAKKVDLKGYATKVLHGAKDVDKFIVQMRAPMKILISAALAWGINAGSTYVYGKLAKYNYKKLRLLTTATAIQSIRSDDRAKALVWLLLAKDVFNRVPLEQAKQYAAIVNHEIPLVITPTYNEKDKLFEAYKNNPKIIDTLMISLRRDLNFDAKLYLVKLVVAGMLLKGTIDPDKDRQTLETLGIGLGIVPPPKSNFESINVRDPRVGNLLKYNAMIARMEQAASTKAIASTKHVSKAEKKNPQFKRWPRSAQIILQDYEDSNVPAPIQIMDEVDKKGTVSADDLNKAENVVKNTGGPEVDPATGKPFDNSGASNGGSQGPATPDDWTKDMPPLPGTQPATPNTPAAAPAAKAPGSSSSATANKSQQPAANGKAQPTVSGKAQSPPTNAVGAKSQTQAIPAQKPAPLVDPHARFVPKN